MVNRHSDHPSYTMSQIAASFRGSLRRPYLSGEQPHENAGSHPQDEKLRLLASLCELREGDTLLQVNQPVNISEVNSQSNPENMVGHFDVSVEFHGLKASAVQHPLLAATVAKQHENFDLCLCMRVMSERRGDVHADVGNLEVIMFGGVIIDTQGVALGSEVHATVLMFECAPGVKYDDSLLRKVCEGEGERLIGAGTLRQMSREDHLEVSFTSCTSLHGARIFDRSGPAISRSLLNARDRDGRNTVIVTVETLGISSDDVMPTGSAIDISARLVDGRDRIVSASLCDCIASKVSGKDMLPLPRFWLPAAGGDDSSGNWRCTFFTAPGILSTSIRYEGLYIVLSINNLRDVEVMLREGYNGFDPHAFRSSPSLTFEHDGIRFSVTVRLISSEIPISGALATVIEHSRSNQISMAPSVSTNLLNALSNKSLLASDFSEVSPFVEPLLNGAFKIMQNFPKDSEISIRAGGLVMRVFAAADAVGGQLAHAVGVYISKLFGTSHVSIKIMYLVAISAETSGNILGKCQGTSAHTTRRSDLKESMENWPLKTVGPNGNEYVLEHTWSTMIQLAFHSHRVSLSFLDAQNSNTTPQKNPNGSSQVLLEGLRKSIKAISKWIVNKLPQQKNKDAFVERAVTSLSDVVTGVFEFQSDASAVLIPLESFLQGLLPPEEPKSLSNITPNIVIKAMLCIQDHLSIPAVKQAIVLKDTEQFTMISLISALADLCQRMLSSEYGDKYAHDGIVEVTATLRDAINTVKGIAGLWWERGQTRLSSLLLDLLRTVASSPATLQVNERFTESVGLLICAIAGVLNRNSWEALRSFCEEDNPTGMNFISLCNMIYNSATSYCRLYSQSEPAVGASLVELIHVLLSANTIEMYTRTALKMTPRCHMILRSTNGASKQMSPDHINRVFETLPASCAALLLQHSKSVPNSHTTSNFALRLSFEISWIEALTPLLGDVDVFVNETAANCLQNRLELVKAIMSDARAANPPKELEPLLDTYSRRIAKCLHRICSSFPSTKMSAQNPYSWDCLSTNSAWWFKPQKVYSHILKLCTPALSFLNDAAQVCRLYAQLWETDPEVASMAPACETNHHVFTVLMILSRRLIDLKLHAEAASCLAAASRWHAPNSRFNRNKINGETKVVIQSSTYASAMCLASASEQLNTSGLLVEAFWCMMSAFNMFLDAYDIQRASYCSDILNEWLKNVRSKPDTLAGVQQMKTSLTQAQRSARSDGLDHVQRIVPWYFLVTFEGGGFSICDESLHPNSNFVYILYSEALESDATHASLHEHVASLALALKSILKKQYFVFDDSSDTIDVVPALKIEKSLRNDVYSSDVFETFVALGNATDDNDISTSVFASTREHIPFMKRLPVECLSSGITITEKDKLDLLRKDMQIAPCIASAWSSFAWCQKLCSKESMSFSVEPSISTGRMKPKSVQPSVTANLKTTEPEAKQHSHVSEVHSTKKKKTAGLSRRFGSRKAKANSRSKATGSGSTESKSVPKSEPKSEPKSQPPAEPPVEPPALELPSGDVPAWMLGMQDSLASGSDNAQPAPQPKKDPPKKSAETKKAIAYARSLGAFMSPDDAMLLMTGVEEENKVVIDCVVTTDKGSKDALAEITPEHVFIFYATKGMFGGSKKKTMYKFEMQKKLSVQEAPTPRLMMLMAPELNGEMLYINCDKRGMFKGAVAAFQKKLKVETSASGTGGGGGDGWGPSAW